MTAQTHAVPNRDIVVLIVILLAFSLLMARAADLQLISSEDLKQLGSDRYVRNETINANRGVITDRNGETLAISTAVESVWADPSILRENAHHWERLARALDIAEEQMQADIERYDDNNRQFMYLRRHLTSQHAQRILALQIPGVSLMREYRRFYPHGPITASLLGVTNIDDDALEGIELAKNSILKGVPGSKRVIKDRRGRTVESVHVTRVEDGQDLRLTIDARIQQLIYRELLAVLTTERATLATSVVVHIPTGEILGIATAPSFNPNVISDRKITRNQAATDVFEPGSIAKPFMIAKALMQGTVTPDTMIDTTPGHMRIGGYTVEDIRNFGELSVADIVMKSSNVGVTKIGLQMDANELMDFYRTVGFGSVTGSGLPGEHTGLFREREKWYLSEHATLSYGYGFAVTALQIVQAYSAIANDGVLVPLTIFPDAQPRGSRRIMPEPVANELKRMLERVVSAQGTSQRAEIPLYRVAGKTATVQKLVDGSYSNDQHLAMFVGFAPVSNPQLAAVVIVDNPQQGSYYGGVIAAPIFQKVISAALRILDVPPDRLNQFADGKSTDTPGVKS